MVRTQSGTRGFGTAAGISWEGEVGDAGRRARTSECSDAMLEEPGMDCTRERHELCPLPKTLPPRTSNEPCWISCVEFSASAAASSKKRE